MSKKNCRTKKNKKLLELAYTQLETKTPLKMKAGRTILVASNTRWWNFPNVWLSNSNENAREDTNNILVFNPLGAGPLRFKACLRWRMGKACQYCSKFIFCHDSD